MDNSRFKFRFWHKTLKMMIDDCLIDSSGACFRDNYNSCESQECSVSLDDFIYDISSDVIVMQWTGLKDRNGLDVYEGDYIKGFDGSVEFEVKWSDEDCAFICENSIKGSGAMTNQEYMMNFSVIGNIYANPELIKEK